MARRGVAVGGRAGGRLGVLLGALLGLACASAAVDDTIGIAGAAALPRPHKTAESVFLAVPHLRQEHDLCVPTSAAMVMGYYGDPHPPRELKVLSRGRRYDPQAPFSDFTITWWKDLIAGIEPLGYRWREEVFPLGDAGFRSGLDRIEASLRAGRPVLVDVALYGSHTFVVAGFDAAGRRVFVRDPNLARPGLRILSFAELQSIWTGRSYGLHARPALFTAPAS